MFTTNSLLIWATRQCFLEEGTSIHLDWGLATNTGCPDEERRESVRGALGLGNSSVQRPGDDRLPHTNGIARPSTSGCIGWEGSVGSNEDGGIVRSPNGIYWTDSKYTEKPQQYWYQHCGFSWGSKIILDDENEGLMKVNLFNNINYVLELCHKSAVTLKGKYCSEIRLSHGHGDFFQGRWSFQNFTIHWD